jgi:hypothetical protein
MQTYKRQAFRAAVQAANQDDGAEDTAFQAELSELEVELQSAEEVRIATILEVDGAMDDDADLSGAQPLLEREFAELLVRCVAEGAARKGGLLGHMTLFRSLYQALAEKVSTNLLSINWFSSSFHFPLASTSGLRLGGPIATLLSRAISRLGPRLVAPSACGGPDQEQGPERSHNDSGAGERPLPQALEQTR